MLHTLADEGHVYCPRDVLVKTCLDVLGEKRRKDEGVAGAPESSKSGTGPDGSAAGFAEGASAKRAEGMDGTDSVSGEATAEDILRAIASATAANRLVVDAHTPGRGAPKVGALSKEESFPQELSADGGEEFAPAVYLAKYHTCEEGIASGLLGLCRCGASPAREISPAAVEAVLRLLPITLAEAQRDALRMALALGSPLSPEAQERERPPSSRFFSNSSPSGGGPSCWRPPRGVRRSGWPRPRGVRRRPSTGSSNTRLPGEPFPGTPPGRWSVTCSWWTRRP